MYSKDLIKGTLKPIILSLLAENGRMYGYEMTQMVRERTDGRIEITEGALYPLLHKLEADGVVSTEKEFIGKRVRKYYSLTSSGKSLVSETVNELTDFIDTLSGLLRSKPSVI